MTKQRLENMRRLRTEIEVIREQIHLLRTVAEYGTTAHAPHGKGGFAPDRTGHSAARIADLEAKLRNRIGKYLLELYDADEFIAGIPDSELRMIFTLRYINGKSWLSIAFKLGYYDEQVPRKKAERFLRATA